MVKVYIKIRDKDVLQLKYNRESMYNNYNLDILDIISI